MNLVSQLSELFAYAREVPKLLAVYTREYVYSVELINKILYWLHNTILYLDNSLEQSSIIVVEFNKEGEEKYLLPF